MGWSWSLYFIQRLHIKLAAEGSDFPARCVFQDDKFLPPMGGAQVCLISYGDNFNIFGTNADLVNQKMLAAKAHMKKKGLILHEETTAPTHIESLGYIVDGNEGRVHGTPRKLYLLHRICQCMESGFRVVTKELQRFLGHVVHILLLLLLLLLLYFPLLVLLRWGHGYLMMMMVMMMMMMMMI